MPVEDTTGKILKARIREHVEPGSQVHADEALAYCNLQGYKHGTVRHSAGEYAGTNDIHTNSIESVWAILKRGLYGVWNHASQKHLYRYLNEATFRLNEGNCSVHSNARIDAMLAKAFTARITCQQVTA